MFNPSFCFKKGLKGKGKSRKKTQITQKSEQQLFILNSWWEQKISSGGIDATLVDAEEKRALAQATGAHSAHSSPATPLHLASEHTVAAAVTAAVAAPPPPLLLLSPPPLLINVHLRLTRPTPAGLDLKILDYWLSNTRKKARKQFVSQLVSRTLNSLFYRPPKGQAPEHRNRTLPQDM